MAEEGMQLRGYPQLYSRIPMVITRDYGRKMGSTALHVLLALSTYADFKTGECWPSISSLAEMVGVTQVTIRTALKKLQALGLLEVKQRFGEDGRQLSNIYCLVVPGTPVPDDCSNDSDLVDKTSGQDEDKADLSGEDKTDLTHPLKADLTHPLKQALPELYPSELYPSELNIIVDSVESTLQATPKAPPAAPTSFQGWLDLIQESTNRIAVLRHMYETLYPKHDPPDYGKIGRAAKVLGGASRLAAALWETATRPPTGCVLEYVIAAENNRRDRAKHDARGAPRYGKDKPDYLKHEFTPEQLAKMACGETVI